MQRRRSGFVPFPYSGVHIRVRISGSEIPIEVVTIRACVEKQEERQDDGDYRHIRAAPIFSDPRCFCTNLMPVPALSRLAVVIAYARSGVLSPLPAIFNSNESVLRFITDFVTRVSGEALQNRINRNFSARGMTAAPRRVAHQRLREAAARPGFAEFF